MKPLRLTSVLCGVLLFGHALANDFNPSSDLKSQATDFVKVENPEYLSGIKKVVITSFMVDFVSELKHSKQLSGIGIALGGDSDVSIKLVGGSNEQFQAITNTLYERTLAQLKQQGIEVVSKEELASVPEFTELVTRGIQELPSPEDAKAGKGLFFTANQLPLYHMDERNFITSFNPFDKPKEDLFLTFGSRFSSGFSQGGNLQLEEKIAEKLGAHVMKVRLTVLGGQLTPDTSFWSSGKVSTRAAASFVDFVNRYALISPQGKKSRVSLKKTVSTDDVGELVNITSGVSKTADVAKNVATLATFAARLGGINAPQLTSFSSTQDFECRVQPDAFEQKLVSYYDGVAGMLTHKLAQPN